MTFDDFTHIQKLLEECNDNIIWNPIADQESVNVFDYFISEIEASQEWKKELNWKKGRLLEEFAEFLFRRFVFLDDIKANRLAGGNETDIEVIFGDKPKPSFVNDFIGTNIICECKNKKSASIDVGTVTKLDELLDSRRSRFGVFISILGIGGSGWKFGEGKRKKLFIRSDRKKPIISFTVNELSKLRDGKSNFYTMLKQKVHLLLDEVDDEAPDLPSYSNPDYLRNILMIVDHFARNQLASEEEITNIRNRISLRYGLPEEE
ncbi:hypothetical protein [Tumebacillus flagellatus]|uniref:Restriction endonuclease type IV Mrr domain-containing protein n=1 Tax=Tumebacillus flagellatus TaxID=1157490 RepID=A0A074LNX9_9BACL|nr:hypothetical protein [Tumebacillus flagellatus]KEO83876.1 hypothetical protein EL26_08135 [Tumebacillus flagellatus]